jgi:PHP family Zn ribbon phosphoesterase
MLATIEFFPQEGKYHYDGHRACLKRLSPRESLALKNRCPVCGKGLTLGVLHRVEELADRPDGYHPADAIPYYSIIPLAEIIAESKGVGRDTASVQQVYDRITEAMGGEFRTLLWASEEELAKTAGDEIAQGIMRMRKGRVKVEEGYDGVFGKISVFSDFLKRDETEEQEKKDNEQLSLF